MRAYFFLNMYLSQIQRGIQAAHATSRIHIKYEGCQRYDALQGWAHDHETMILLNGGYASNLRRVIDALTTCDEQDIYLPWAEFHEEEDALDGALTCVGVVLPTWVYELAAMLRNEKALFSNPDNLLFSDEQAIDCANGDTSAAVPDEQFLRFWEPEHLDEDLFKVIKASSNKLRIPRGLALLIGLMNSCPLA